MRVSTSLYSDNVAVVDDVNGERRRFAKRKPEMCTGTFNNPSMKLLVIRDAIPETSDLIIHLYYWYIYICMYLKFLPSFVFSFMSNFCRSFITFIFSFSLNCFYFLDFSISHFFFIIFLSCSGPHMCI